MSREEFGRRWRMVFGKEEEDLGVLHSKLERSVIRVIQSEYASRQLHERPECEDPDCRFYGRSKMVTKEEGDDQWHCMSCGWRPGDYC